MRPSGEPVSGCSLHREPAPEVALPLLRAGEDPAPTVAEADNFALGDEAPDPSPCFSVDTSSTVTAVAPSTAATVTQSQVPVSEGESVPIVPAGHARAILQCFAGQAQLAAASTGPLCLWGRPREAQVCPSTSFADGFFISLDMRLSSNLVRSAKDCGCHDVYPQTPPGVTHVGLHVCGDRRLLGEELASRFGGAYAGSLLGKPGTPACLAEASAYSAGELGCLGPLPPWAKLGDV